MLVVQQMVEIIVIINTLSNYSSSLSLLLLLLLLLLFIIPWHYLLKMWVKQPAVLPLFRSVITRAENVKKKIGDKITPELSKSLKLAQSVEEIEEIVSIQGDG